MCVRVCVRVCVRAQHAETCTRKHARRGHTTGKQTCRDTCSCQLILYYNRLGYFKNVLVAKWFSAICCSQWGIALHVFDIWYEFHAICAFLCVAGLAAMQTQAKRECAFVIPTGVVFLVVVQWVL